MIKYKKTRGHNRILKNIDNWVQNNRKLDVEYLKKRQRDYVKVWVAPYSNLSILNSEFSPPRGKTRKRIVEGIFTIYDNWKAQLEKLGEPYYCKIWYFPHDVSKNQVVCAIGDFLSFYEGTFYKPAEQKKFQENTKGLIWEYRHQEYHVTIDDIEEPEMFETYQDYLNHKKWVEGIMTHPKTRITHHTYEDGVQKTFYSLKECDVWIGG